MTQKILSNGPQLTLSSVLYNHNSNMLMMTSTTYIYFSGCKNKLLWQTFNWKTLFLCCSSLKTWKGLGNIRLFFPHGDILVPLITGLVPLLFVKGWPMKDLCRQRGSQMLWKCYSVCKPDSSWNPKQPWVTRHLSTVLSINENTTFIYVYTHISMKYTIMLCYLLVCPW